MVFRKLTLAVLAAAVLLAGAGILVYRGHRSVPYGSRTEAKKEYIDRVSARSRDLSGQAVQALKVKRFDDAVRLLVEAVNIFPSNTEAFAMLVQLFLKTKQEVKVYEALEHAGRSYPSFDDILSIINDADLAAIPLSLEYADADVYIAPFQGNKTMAMSFMFDDGESSVYTKALPLFEKYGYRASISVIAGQVASVPGIPQRGSWPEWKDAADRGFEIANHSMHHWDAKSLKPSDFKTEIDDAKAMIEKNVGRKVVSYVFPMDIYSRELLSHVIRSHPAARDPDYLRLFYKRAVDIMYGGKKFSVHAANRLVDIGIQRRLWLIAECHGIDSQDPDSYKPLSSNFLGRHLSYVHAHAADIWVDTFGHVFEYLFLRKWTQVVRKDLMPGKAEIILHNPSLKTMLRPLTVVLRVGNESVHPFKAWMSDGRSLKVWLCGAGQVCVDVPEYDRVVHVTWGSPKQ